MVLVLLAAGSSLQAQTQPAHPADSMYRVVKTDGSILVGKLLQSDAREILFRTQDGREIYIPQHVIKRMEPLSQEKRNLAGEFVGEDRFATRYFITTNGLPIKKGDHYVQWNLFGPDFHFAIRDDLSVGVMTTWLGTPLIGSIKKSWKLNDVSQFAVGGLFGTGSWIMPDWGGALPFGTISFGDRQKNIACSGGYGAIWTNGDRQGRTLLSVAGMVKLSNQFSLVFDSFIMPAGPDRTVTYTYQAYVFDPVTGQGGYEQRTGSYVQRQTGFSLLIPGIRWHQSEGRAFQVGFSGVVADGETFPIPMVVWYRSLK